MYRFSVAALLSQICVQGPAPHKGIYRSEPSQGNLICICIDFAGRTTLRDDKLGLVVLGTLHSPKLVYLQVVVVMDITPLCRKDAERSKGGGGGHRVQNKGQIRLRLRL